MPVNFQINNHIIMPFGCEKWNINQIQVIGVSANTTYFESKAKCAYIDKSKSKPLRLSMFPEFFPKEMTESLVIDDTRESLKFMQTTLKNNCMVGTVHEKKFLGLYFDYINKVKDEYITIRNEAFFQTWEFQHSDELQYANLQDISDLMQFLHLMPFPQAHIYVDDPFKTTQHLSPNRMLRVDFAFWTGKKIIVIEIDGSSHIGSRAHVERDRLLLRAGVHVIHVLNEEIDEYGTDFIQKLFPPEYGVPRFVVSARLIGLSSAL